MYKNTEKKSAGDIIIEKILDAIDNTERVPWMKNYL